MALCACIIPSCREAGPVSVDGASAPEQAARDDSALVAGEMIVELSDELCSRVEEDLAAGGFLQTRSQQMNSVFAAMGASSVRRLFEDGGEWEPRHRQAGLHKWYVVSYDPSLPRTKAVTDLEAIDGIVTVEPVRRIKPMAIFDDPMLPQQWHYINDGTVGKDHKKGCDINVERVWENFTGGSSDVIVAVVDGGIDMTHPDLAAVTIPGGANGSKNFVTGSYNVTPHSHGTHVAGTIGAINNNGIGVAGIAGGLDGKGGVRLLSCQVFATGSDGKDIGGDFYNAVIWGADHGAVISQNSWGYTYDSKEDAARGSIGASMKKAVDYFIDYAGTDKNGNQVGPMKGGVVIFAAGNEAWPNGWPAQYERIVAVGSVAPDFTRAYYSNYGDWVDIAAPGGSYTYEKGQVLSTTPGNTYSWFQGTSMACPHVSGVAALLVSHFGGPGFTNEMLKERLLGGANSHALSPVSKIGPLVDAFGSFSYGSTTPPNPVEDFSVSAESNNIDFTWNVTRDEDDMKAYGYLVLACKLRGTLENLNPSYTIPPSVSYSTVEVGELKPGSPLSGRISGLDFDTDYYTAIIGFDYSKNYSVISPLKKISTGHNSQPVIETDYSGDFKVKAHETLNVDLNIYDPDGHRFELQFTPGSTAATNTLLPSGLYRLSIVGTAADPGVYTAVYTATDTYGAGTTKAFEYQILENHAPEVVKNPDNFIFEKTGAVSALDMSEYLQDPDGEQLTYEVKTEPAGIVHFNRVDNVLNLTTLDFGLAKVSITGTDCKGLKATIDFQILVRKPDSAPDVYPTVVADYLNVSDGTEKSVSVLISNAAGAVLYDASADCDSFNPIVVDMRSWAPGRYTVKVVSKNVTYRTSVVKK